MFLHSDRDGVRASCRVESSSGDGIIDVNHNGSTVFTDPLQIDEGDTTSYTSTAPPVFDSPQFADNADIQIDVLSAGTGTMGLRVLFRGVRVAP